MYKKSVFLLVFFLVGCATSPDPYRVRLDALADKYLETKSEMVRLNEAGKIDPEVWEFFKAVDDEFAVQWSAIVVDMSDEFDPEANWKYSLAILIDALKIAAPIVDIATGVPIASPIVAAIDIGNSMLDHTKRGVYSRGDAERLKVLRRMAKGLKQ